MIVHVAIFVKSFFAGLIRAQLELSQVITRAFCKVEFEFDFFADIQCHAAFADIGFQVEIGQSAGGCVE